MRRRAITRVNVRLPFSAPFSAPEYKHLTPAWHDWSAVRDRAAAAAVRLPAGEEK